MRAVVMDHTYAKSQGQKSLSSEVEVRTDRQTNKQTDKGVALITSSTKVVGNDIYQ